MSLVENLDQYLDQADGMPDQPQQAFVIDTPEKADWAVRKILRLQTKNEEINQIADDRIEKVEAWRKQTKSENDRSIEYLVSLLRPFAEQQLDGKKKTVRLPSGDVNFRATPTQFFIAGQKVDGKNQVLTSYVKQNAPEYLKIEESTNWAEFKKTLTITSTGQVIANDGEILNFIYALEYPDTIIVKERK
ncbi:hypothetical protein SCACP_21620 [Sporomusa carbonis]|uniref:host-nuclease inhibitor Gam family protein n=1 Tax=Sporomusa carbonis TaxID=3076075 RepID=UPI003A6A1028